MDMYKMGIFLKTLRKQKGLTQEKLAEILQVSSRTISRWENGSHLPDMDTLIYLADYYNITLRELIDGERKRQEEDNERSRELLMAAAYSKKKEQLLMRKTFFGTLVGITAWIVSFVFMLLFSDAAQGAVILLIMEGIGLFLYGGIMLCLKSNRTVSGCISSLIGAFSAVVCSNVGLFLLFFGKGEYTNHGLIAAYWSFFIILVTFAAAGTAVCILNHRYR